MEPKLIRKDINYQKKTLIVVSLLVISLFVGGSFALLSSSDETGEVVTFKTGNFNLEAKTTGTLSLDGEVPKSYDDGFKNNDITLTLTNTGSLEIGKYDVKLEGDSTTTLESNYIRYSVSDDEGKTYLASKLLSETDNIIYTGYSLKTTKVLKVKLWIDEAAGENALKKSYNGKINVELYQNEDTLVDVVKSKLVSNYSGSNESFPGGLVAVNNDGNLYHETNSETIREYRYSGPTVNNYVTFNDEVWRIVGVFKDESGEEHVKIVRNNILETDKLPVNYILNENTYKIKYSDTLVYYNRYNDKNGELNPDTYNNDWTISGLKYYLNTNLDSENNKGYLSYLNQYALSMIQTTKYYLGTVTYLYTSDSEYGILDTVYEAYKNERDIKDCNNIESSPITSGCRVWQGNQTTWEGEIGLMYPSDYGFSANSVFWNKSLRLANFNGTPANSSWMQNSTNHSGWEWFLSPSTAYNANHSTGWNESGFIHYANTREAAYSVRPTLYLKNNVKITSGDGTSTNPYNLILE